MKYIKEFTIIVIISFLGEMLNRLLPFPIPGSIYGLFIMLLLLVSGILKVSNVRDTSGFLIEIMPIMFIPPAVGLITSWTLIQPIWIKLLVFTLLSTIGTLAASGLVTDFIIKRGKK